MRFCDAPHDAGVDELRVPQLVVGVRDRRFGQDGLGGRVHLGRDEIDAALGDHVAGLVNDLHRKVGLELSGALDGHVDVSFEASGLVDCGQRGGGRDPVADPDRNVSDDSGAGGGHAVVVQLHDS